MNAVIDDGMKLKASSRKFGIPALLLKDHLFDKTTTRKRCNPPTLKSEEEKKLIDYIFKMKELGHPLILAQPCLKVSIAIETREMPWTTIKVPR